MFSQWSVPNTLPVTVGLYESEFKQSGGALKAG